MATNRSPVDSACKGTVRWAFDAHVKSLLRIQFPRSVPLLQYILRNMHTDFVLLCFVVVIHWLIFPYPSGLLRRHCGNLTIAPVPAKQPWWIWINTSCEFIMNDCITTTKQSTTKPCAYFLGYTVSIPKRQWLHRWSMGTDKWFEPTLYNGFNYLSITGLKLDYDRETVPGSHVCVLLWFGTGRFGAYLLGWLHCPKMVTFWAKQLLKTWQNDSHESTKNLKYHHNNAECMFYKIFITVARDNDIS